MASAHQGEPLVGEVEGGRPLAGRDREERDRKGAKKLPQIGSGLGQGIQNFRKAVKGKDETEEPDLLEEKEKQGHDAP